MPIPDAIKVGGFAYQILADGSKEVDLAEDGYQALTSHRELTIALSERHIKMQQESLLHEILHCIALYTNLTKVWGDSAEDYVFRLSRALYAVLKDNPAFLVYLAED